MNRIGERLLACIDSERRSQQPWPAEREDLVEWTRVWPFVLMHLGIAGVVVVGASAVAVWTAVWLYALRMFGITAFYHRGLSHRAFAAPRPVMFVGALLATLAAQRGPLWWAAHHRKHHRHADAPGDAHSPHLHGFWWSHVGWFTTRRNFRTDWTQVRDLQAFRELVLLDRFDVLAPLGLLAGLFAAGELLARHLPETGTSGAQMVVWGFCISTTAVFHVTSAVNSLAHRHGSRDYATGDTSRNSFVLALLTFGEGWHNNHHFHPGAVRQGFRWWQVDLTYYVLRGLAALGVVSALRPLPPRVWARAKVDAA